jgi:hypothetical protein
MFSKILSDARFNRAPGLCNLFKSRRQSVRQRGAQVNPRQDEQRQHHCEIKDANQRAEDYPVRPARAMTEDFLIGPPEETKDAPTRVLARLDVQVWAEH